MMRICLPLLCLATPVLADGPELTVYTYDSFAAEWGPGPAAAAAFEAMCACDLVFVTAGDGAALLSRLMLEGAGTNADVVLGLDQNLIDRARATGLFAPHGQTALPGLPVPFVDDMFVPFDWGNFAFVADVDTPAPTDFRALAASDLTIVIQDPRSSTPGLGLVLWVKAAYGDDAGQVWADLADNIVTVTPGWSESYGLFLAGEADAVLSYTTSPAYHLIAEGDATKTAWEFTEGHPVQIEVAALLAGSDQPDLARSFLAFLTTDAFQSLIPTGNWMYPAYPTPLPEGFGTLISPTALPLSFDDAARTAAVEEWRATLAQ